MISKWYKALSHEGSKVIRDEEDKSEGPLAKVKKNYVMRSIEPSLKKLFLFHHKSSTSIAEHFNEYNKIFADQ